MQDCYLTNHRYLARKLHIMYQIEDNEVKIKNSGSLPHKSSLFGQKATGYGNAYQNFNDFQ